MADWSGILDCLELRSLSDILLCQVPPVWTGAGCNENDLWLKLLACLFTLLGEMKFLAWTKFAIELEAIAVFIWVSTIAFWWKGFSILAEFLFILRFYELNIDLKLLVGEFLTEAFIDLSYYSWGEFAKIRFRWDFMIALVSLVYNVSDFLFLLCSLINSCKAFCEALPLDSQ